MSSLQCAFPGGSGLCIQVFGDMSVKKQGFSSGLCLVHSGIFQYNKEAEKKNKRCNRNGLPRCFVSVSYTHLDVYKRQDRDWVPHTDGASLYIRPFIFANDVGLGVHASKHYIFCIICAPSGAYYAEGINPVRIYVEDEYIRAAPGLTGFTKCGGNYAASIKAGETIVYL